MTIARDSGKLTLEFRSDPMHYLPKKFVLYNICRKKNENKREKRKKRGRKKNYKTATLLHV
jgi:hypothetical protein